MAIMDRQQKKTVRRTRRRTGIRKRVIGTPDRPRMAVYRSLAHIYVQIIDDLSGRTLCSASTRDKDIKTSGGGNVDAAKVVGTKVAERAKASGVTQVTFDRGGFRYHGRIKALADAARQGGLQF
ncbi:MAG: 50S ribosomal protein L18 [Phycisphaeraceae bacterium]|nr:50S ribosomal protein L18 [Phycisphaeraceae bacterium]MCW5762957.1 50S ribosomal protein L18 [Phycisphaeraceae bacterium]